ncbi:MAG TPA: hypothetical protein VH437_18640 [Terriglobales bacterium]
MVEPPTTAQTTWAGPFPSYRSTGQIDWSRAMPVALKCGAIAAFLMILPLGILGLIGVGAFAVELYRRRVPGMLCTTGMGARLGALSGVMGFGIFTVSLAVLVGLTHSGDRVREHLLEAIQRAAEGNPDPQVQQAFDYFKTPDGLALALVIGLAMTFVICLLLSSVGGALGAHWFGKRRSG